MWLPLGSLPSPSPSPFHSCLIEADLRESYPKTGWQIGGERDGLFHRSSPSVALVFLLHLFHLLACLSEFSLCPRMTNGQRKVSRPWNLKQAESSGLAFSLPILQWQSIPADNYVFYFYFLTSIKEIETVFFPKHSPLMRCQKVKQKSQTLVSNIRHLYSNYNDPMCLGFHYLE